MVDRNATALERAFELAESGSHPTVSSIRARVSREGYDGRQVEGRALSKQLAELSAPGRLHRPFT